LKWTLIEWSSVENAVANLAEPIGAETPLTNADSINGGVVVVERSENEFGTKALRAQEAGAEAVLIANNDRKMMETLNWPGADGVRVTIPVYMVDREDAMKLVNALWAPSMTVSIIVTRKFPPSLPSIVNIWVIWSMNQCNPCTHALCYFVSHPF
jgi:hypothetical protein